jgi:hypothetical protein
LRGAAAAATATAKVGHKRVKAIIQDIGRRSEAAPAEPTLAAADEKVVEQQAVPARRCPYALPTLGDAGDGWRLSPKNIGPDQCDPVICRAIAVSER